MNSRTSKALDDEEWNSLLAFTERLADSAAEETLRFFRQSPEIENKGVETGFDPVTLADKRAEQAMVKEIEKSYPDHGVIGEETGTINNQSDYQWVIDPIDGTGSYICGIPLWGTLIGLLKKGDPVLGVMDQPFLKERYIGRNNKSVCRINGEEVTLVTSPVRSLDQARLATTSPHLFTQGEKAQFDTLQQAAMMTRYGTDCSAYGLLASGQIDLVMEAGLNSYDILALIPIIEGAGGVVSTWQNGSAAKGGQILASANPDLHQQALERIAG